MTLVLSVAATRNSNHLHSSRTNLHQLELPFPARGSRHLMAQAPLNTVSKHFKMYPHNFLSLVIHFTIQFSTPQFRPYQSRGSPVTLTIMSA